MTRILQEAGELLCDLFSRRSLSRRGGDQREPLGDVRRSMPLGSMQHPSARRTARGRPSSPTFANVYRVKVGHRAPISAQIQTKLLISLALPRGLQEFQYIKALVESGTRNLPTEFHSNLGLRSHPNRLLVVSIIISVANLPSSAAAQARSF